MMLIGINPILSPDLLATLRAMGLMILLMAHCFVQLSAIVLMILMRSTTKLLKPASDIYQKN